MIFFFFNIFYFFVLLTKLQKVEQLDYTMWLVTQNVGLKAQIVVH